jgi:hypothetical protein
VPRFSSATMVCLMTSRLFYARSSSRRADAEVPIRRLFCHKILGAVHLNAFHARQQQYYNMLFSVIDETACKHSSKQKGLSEVRDEKEAFQETNFLTGCAMRTSLRSSVTA